MKNNYYVYVHKIKATGEIFYVGKGRNLRYRSRHGRNRIWKEIVSGNECIFEILISGLTEDEAVQLEIDKIDTLKPRANIHKTDIRAKDIDWEIFSRIYYYDPTSPSGLRYVHGNKQHDHRKRVANEPAGHLSKSTGYYYVHYNYRNYLAHRVIWALVNKENPQGFIIDHIDRNRSNNKIGNLRKVTTSENTRNTSLKAHNKTGFNGVTYLANFQLYVATWVEDNGKALSKSFSALKHGDELAKALAIEYRHRMVSKNKLYLTDTTYERQPALLSYSEEQLDDLLECDLIASNNSGIRRISLQNIGGCFFWVYRSETETMNFSCTKFGNDKAKEFAIAYKEFVESGRKDFESLSDELKTHLNNPTRANNSSGFENISFIGKNKDTVLVQLVYKKKGKSKSFDTKKYGLLPSIAKAKEWLEYTKKNKELIC